MTNAFEPMRIIGREINNRIGSIKSVKIGVVKDVSRRQSSVQVKILENNDELDKVWIEWLFPYSGNGVQMGGMPLIDSKVIIIFLDGYNEDEYENAFAFGGFFDDVTNVKPNSTNSNANDDRWFFTIKPKNGGSIEFYEISEDDHQIVITARKDLITNVANDYEITVENKTNLACDDISLGTVDLDSTKCLANAPHIDVYNGAITEANNIFTALFSNPFIGDMGFPIPLAVRSSAAFSAFIVWQTKYALPSNGLLDNGNKTTKTKAN